MPELHLNHITFRHRDAKHDLFRDYSGRFTTGITWMRGRNGVGKTTLLEIIAGLRMPAAGEVLLDGVRRAKQRVILAPSTPPVFDELNASEHVALMIELWQLRGPSSEQYRARVDAMLAAFSVSHDLVVGSYSAGMREKLAFSLFAAIEADVLLLDEPFTASDAGSLAVGKSMLRQLAERRVIIVTSHLDAVLDGLDPSFVELAPPIAAP